MQQFFCTLCRPILKTNFSSIKVFCDDYKEQKMQHFLAGNSLPNGFVKGKKTCLVMFWKNGPYHCCPHQLDNKFPNK